MWLQNLKQFLKENHFFLEKYENFIEQKEKIQNKLYVKFAPIQKNKIVFDNFNGNGFGGKPAIIAQELIKKEINAELIWVSYEKPKGMDQKIKWIQYESNEAYKAWRTAHIWIDNVRHKNNPPKRKGQYYIQTWHGSIGMKKVEMLAEDKLSESYIKTAKEDSKIADLLLASCETVKQRMEKDFWYNGEIMISEFSGVASPEEREQMRSKVCCTFNISNSCNIILYAPTFRNNPDYNYFSLDFFMLMETVAKKFGGDWCIITRLHPNVYYNNKLYRYDSRVYNGTLYPDIDDLMYASDIVISDYSGIVFDAIRRNIKTFLFAPDFEEYESKERGFVIDPRSIPAPMAMSQMDLIENIETFDYESYLNKCKCFNDNIGYVSDRRNIDNVIDRITKVLG